MKQIRILLLLFFQSLSLSLLAQSDFSMELFAGSNAAWGKGRYLSIDAKGNCIYTLSDARRGTLDSSAFSITRDELSRLRETVNKIGFFKLSRAYNEESLDGTVLTAIITSSGKKHEVSWYNVHTSESTQLTDRLNAILKRKGITITY